MVSKPSLILMTLLSYVQEKWDNIINNELNPMFNRSSMGTYPPGSIFKLIVASLH